MGQFEEVALANLAMVREHRIPLFGRLFPIQLLNGRWVEPQVLQRTLFRRVVQVQCVELEASEIEAILVVQHRLDDDGFRKSFHVGLDG